MEPKTVKKLKNGNLLIEVKRKKHDFLLKRKIFHTKKKKKTIVYPHQNLNTSKWVVRSQEHFSCPLERIKKELKPPGVTKVKRVSIKWDDKIIDTNTYIMTFDLQTIPPKIKIKIGYTMERVKQFVPNTLRCYKYHKYGRHKDKSNGRSVCGKCGERDPDHSTEKYKNPHRFANCGGDHPMYSKTCEKWKREKEILSIKYNRNVFPRGTEYSWRYRDKTYSQAVSSVTSTEPTSKYQNLVWKLL